MEKKLIHPKGDRYFNFLYFKLSKKIDRIINYQNFKIEEQCLKNSDK